MADWSGKNILVIGLGGVLLWSGVKGVGVSAVIKDILTGKDPHTAPTTNEFIDQGISGNLHSTGGSNTAMAQKNRAIARMLCASQGWVGDQWTAFNNIVNAEDASWDPHAENPSGAYGIPQSLPGSKMASAGLDWKDSPTTQIRWMISYIKARYKTPKLAWQFHLANGYY